MARLGTGSPSAPLCSGPISTVVQRCAGGQVSGMRAWVGRARRELRVLAESLRSRPPHPDLCLSVSTLRCIALSPCLSDSTSAALPASLPASLPSFPPFAACIPAAHLQNRAQVVGIDDANVEPLLATARRQRRRPAHASAPVASIRFDGSANPARSTSRVSDSDPQTKVRVGCRHAAAGATRRQTLLV